MTVWTTEDGVVQQGHVVVVWLRDSRALAGELIFVPVLTTGSSVPPPHQTLKHCRFTMFSATLADLSAACW